MRRFITNGNAGLPDAHGEAGARGDEQVAGLHHGELVDQGQVEAVDRPRSAASNRASSLEPKLLQVRSSARSLPTRHRRLAGDAQRRLRGLGWAGRLLVGDRWVAGGDLLAGLDEGPDGLRIRGWLTVHQSAGG